MTLANYRLDAPSTVIEVDRRDPYVSWENHLARTQRLRGGVDVVAKIGTPIYARTAGWLDHREGDGSAGNSSRFRHRDNPGWSDVFSHLSSYEKPTGAFFEAGEIVAYTGNTGGVDPHLHWHLLDPQGRRQNPWDHFTDARLAGQIGTPLTNTIAGAVWDAEDDNPDDGPTPRMGNQLTLTRKLLQKLTGYRAWQDVPPIESIVWDAEDNGAPGQPRPDRLGYQLARTRRGVEELVARPQVTAAAIAEEVLAGMQQRPSISEGDADAIARRVLALMATRLAD